MPVFKNGDKNVLFIHVPKTGGTSVEKIFTDSGYDKYLYDKSYGKDSPNYLRRSSPQHLHAELLRATLRLNRFDVIFMTTREPMARFKSEYAMRNKEHLKPGEQRVEQWTDSAFAKYIADPFVHDNHLRPQSEFYLPGCIVYPLEDGLESIVDDLNAKHGLNLSNNIPRSMDRQKRSGYSSKDVVVPKLVERRVKEFYHDDFVKFGYPL